MAEPDNGTRPITPLLQLVITFSPGTGTVHVEGNCPDVPTQLMVLGMGQLAIYQTQNQLAAQAQEGAGKIQLADGIIANRLRAR